MWTGIYGDQIMEPLYIDVSLDGETYLKMLETTTKPLIVDYLKNLNHPDEKEF